MIWLKKFYNLTKKWVNTYAGSKFSYIFISFIAFIESIFFPIPTDFFLIPFVLLKKNKWLKYGILTVFFSVLGGIASYYIGLFLFGTIGSHIISLLGLENKLLEVTELFSKGTFFVMFTSAITVIPFKILTLVGGTLKAPIIPFILGSILGRGIRFMFEAWLVGKYGEKIASKVYRIINKYSLIFVLFLFLLIFIFILIK